MGPAALLLGALLLQSPAPASTRRAEAAASSPRLARALALLAEGKNEEALAEAEIALEYAPEDSDLLDAASRAAQALERKDEALFYAVLAAECAGDAPDRKAFLEGVNARIGALDPLQRKGEALLADFGSRALRLGETCAGRGLFANAVDLYGRCAGTPSASRAAAALDRLYAQRKVVDALLETGLDVPIRSGAAASSARAAREDAAHATWERAWEVRSPNYTVVTDLSRSLADQISGAMEQMNRFYRSVFRHKERGGGTARCGIRVYKTRAEFDAHEGSPPASVGGFFAPGENRVATYDARSEGQSLSVLWETLFHEASHQFTHMISADLVPGWLNEGTASYFEGARLLPNGAVATNLVPDARLFEARMALDAGKPTLGDLVAYYEEGSYPGEYYGLGWALVYFLHNYEDGACERVYRPLYGDFVDAYRAGGKHDPFERFVSIFVKKAKQPGIDTFEAFEGRFRRWILDLFEIHFGPPERAAVFAERARKQRENGRREAAVESYGAALRKKPGDAVLLAELGEVEAELKRKDAAFLHLRRAVDAARAGGGGEAFEEAYRRRIEAIDKPLADGLAASRAGLTEGAASIARDYVEAGFPRQGLRVLDGAIRALGGDGALRARRAEIAASSGADGRRWRRLEVAKGLPAWEGDEGWEVEGEALRARTKGMAFLFHRAEVPEPFRFEATLRPLEIAKDAYFALAFGVNAETGITVFGVGKGGFVDAARLGREWKTLQAFAPARLKKEVPVRLAVEVSEEGAEFFRDGKSLGRVPMTAEERRGQIGLLVQEGAAGFVDLRVKS